MKSVFDNGGLETYVFRPTILMRYAEILMIAAEAANELVPDGAPAPEESKSIFEQSGSVLILKKVKQGKTDMVCLII